MINIQIAIGDTVKTCINEFIFTLSSKIGINLWLVPVFQNNI